MRKLAIILLFPLFANATNYYVSNTGSDGAAGTSTGTAWQNISKVNSSFASFAAGDSILFKRGETWYGTIDIGKSGSSGNPIVFGAYGTGAKPIIHGFTTITGWTNEGGGIYSKVITSEYQTNMVTIDGVQYGMGRTPDATYYTYQSFSTNVSITSTSTPAATTNWTGAEAVIRKNDWTLDRNRITGHSSNTLTYTTLATSLNGTNNYGFFIMNDLRTVTAYGEWYHDTAASKFYMYFGGVDPTTKTVKVATLENLVRDDGEYDYIHVDNIDFTGSINDAVWFYYNVTNCIVKNCRVTFAGKNGIAFQFQCTSNTITNDTINTVNRCGIFTSGNSHTMTYNDIRNLGMVLGQAYGGGFINGILQDEGHTALIQYNTIVNSGYNGIYINSTGAKTVQYNFIENACMLLDDGGGIYTTDDDASIRLIDHNVIINVPGNFSGTNRSTSRSQGIYLDENTSNTVITNNTCAYIGRAGIQLHKANTNTIKYNTTFDCDNSGIFLQNSQNSNTIYDNDIVGNIFFAKEATQYALNFQSDHNSIPTFGTADSNYYARPIDDDFSIETSQPNTGDVSRTLATWKSFTGEDDHSNKAYASVADTDDIYFHYNGTNSSTTISLGNYTYYDVAGNDYTGDISLPAWSSIILMNPEENEDPGSSGAGIIKIYRKVITQ